MLKKIFLSIILIFTLFLGIYNNAHSARAYVGPNWEKTSIGVYVPDSRTYGNMMKNAFLKWQNMSYGKINFRFVEQDDADISVIFAQDLKNPDEPIGDYDLTIKNGHITSALIRITPQENSKQDYINAVMLHEVGHALGLYDNTRNVGIMYKPVSSSQEITKNDIMKLYKLNGWSWISR